MHLTVGRSQNDFKKLRTTPFSCKGVTCDTLLTVSTVQIGLHQSGILDLVKLRYLRGSVVQNTPYGGEKPTKWWQIWLWRHSDVI